MSNSQQAQGSGSSLGVSPYRWWILLGLVTAAVMEVLDTSIVNVAIPQISGNLGATLDEVGWVSTGYIISNVIVLPMTSWLSNVFGRRLYLTGSIAIFVVASVFCGTSSSLGTLVFWRIVQGAGGAALLSTAQATLFEVFPRESQGMVQALFGLGIIVAPTLGPTLGGFITDNYNWRWIFYINVPIGIVSAFLVFTFVQNSNYAKKNAHGPDFIGILLLAVGLGCLQTVLEKGERDDWFQASWIGWATAVAVISVIGFIWWEGFANKKNPVVDLSVVKVKSFAAGLPLAFALGMGLYGGVFVFPVFAQNLLRFSAEQTGLALLPGGLATGVSMIICGRIVRLVDPRPLIIFGFTLFVVSMWQLSHLTMQSGIPDTKWPLIIRGFGLGFMFIPLTVASVQTLPRKDIAQGTALYNLFRQLGGSFGIAILNTLIQHQMATHRAALVTYTNAASSNFSSRMDGLTHFYKGLGFDGVSANQAAYGALDRAIQGQAATLAYEDAFRLLAVVFITVVPLLAFLKRPKAAPGPPPDAH